MIEELQAKKSCKTCKKPILYQDLVVFQGEFHHAFHFNCPVCQRILTGATAKEWDNKLLCRDDYERMKNVVCHSCRKPIAGPSVTAMGKYYHPEV